MIKQPIQSKFGKLYLTPNSRISTILGTIILSILCVFLVELSDWYSQVQYNRWMIVSGLIGYVIGQVWNLLCLLYIAHRRFAVVKERNQLTPVQPIGTFSKISVPSTILWHVKWTYIVPWLVIIGWWLAFARWDVMALVVVVAVMLLFYYFFRLKLEINENGLSETGRGTPKKTVYWSEAQLFTCYHIPILFWGKNIVHYELLSQTASVSWIWVSNLRSPFTAWTTNLPSDEYDQQMHALYALVVEKTNLPLYDLNSPRRGEKKPDKRGSE